MRYKLAWNVHVQITTSSNVTTTNSNVNNKSIN